MDNPRRSKCEREDVGKAVGESYEPYKGISMLLKREPKLPAIKLPSDVTSVCWGYICLNCSQVRLPADGARLDFTAGWRGHIKVQTPDLKRGGAPVYFHPLACPFLGKQPVPSPRSSRAKGYLFMYFIFLRFGLTLFRFLVFNYFSI